MNEHILSAKGIFFGYDKSNKSALILQDVSIDIDERSIVAIVGESGSGKSTLARLLCGMLEPTRGEVRYRQAPLRSPAQVGLHLLAQEPYSTFNPYHTVRRILSEPLQANGDLPKDSQALTARLCTTLDEVGLNPVSLDLLPRELSGGQLQRLALARILLLKPRLIIGDEPFSALDVSIRAQILRLMLKLRQEHGLTYVLISHDIDLVERTADRIAVIYRGRIVESGATAEVIARPAHPYTMALKAASPIRRLNQRTASRSVEITRAIQDADAQEGCQFRWRCPWAQERCHIETPTPQVHAGREVSCHFPQGDL